MKNNTKTLLLITLLVSVLGFSQENRKNFNRLSLELNVGSTSLGGGIQGYGPNADFDDYYTETIAPLHVNFGAKYMLNRMYGFKADIAYDGVENDKESSPFKGRFISARLQGVLNLSQLIDSGEDSSKFGMYLHGGFGIAVFSLDKAYTTGSYVQNNNADNLLLAPFGATLQYKLSEKMAINADVTKVLYGKSQLQLDGSRGNHGRVDGNIFNVTLGISYTLGKHAKSIDWLSKKDIKENGNSEDLQKKIAQLEKQLIAQEAKEASDFDKLKELVKVANANTTSVATEVNVPLELINKGYIATYFEFGSAIPTNESTESVDFVVSYLRQHPNAKALLIGYTDEIGGDDFNNELAFRRAENVKKTMVDAGIEEERITVASSGKDNSVDKDSAWARNLVRRVVFKITE